MQKLSLKDFEHHISAATANAADDLAQAGAVKSLREVEKHFWVALVEEPSAAYEVETIITPHKIKAFTCECWSEGRRLMCPHIGATLLKIRQFLEQRAEARQAQLDARQPSELSRFTVQTALENATADELAAFVRDYARRDRDFALALKTWFAGSVTQAENPYALILESVIPKSLSTKPREPEFRRLRNTLNGLEAQAEMARNEENHRSVFQISTAILLKINTLLQKTEEPRRSHLLQASEAAFRRLVDLPAEKLSPELREAIWQTIFEQGVKGALPPEMQREALRWLGESAREEARFEQIRHLFDQAPFPASAFVLQLFVVALAQRGSPEASARVLDDYAEKPDLCRAALLQLYYLRHWEAVALAGERFLQQEGLPAGLRRELEDVLLYVAEQRGDRVRQAAILRQRFLQSGNLDLYERLRAAAGEGWAAARAELFDTLQKRGDRKRIAALLAADGDADVLAQLLENEGDLKHFQLYEAAFLPEKKEFVRGRYLAHLTEYLGEHFGTPAAVYARLHLNHLLQKGETELVLEIIRALTARFPDRVSLPDELAELFPKTKRRAMLAGV
jgi:hypothetical protein